ncbi:MAG: hypothetical protein ACRCY6_06050 [Bacteroidales bacterium]
MKKSLQLFALIALLLSTISFNACTKNTDGYKYTVTFDANDGSGTPPTTQKVKLGEHTALPNKGEMIAPEGKPYLRGWDTDKTAKTASFAVAEDAFFLKNVTLFAIWGTPPLTQVLTYYIQRPASDLITLIESQGYELDTESTNNNIVRYTKTIDYELHVYKIDYNTTTNIIAELSYEIHSTPPRRSTHLATFKEWKSELYTLIYNNLLEGKVSYKKNNISIMVSTFDKFSYEQSFSKRENTLFYTELIVSNTNYRAKAHFNIDNESSDIRLELSRHSDSN